MGQHKQTQRTADGIQCEKTFLVPEGEKSYRQILRSSLNVLRIGNLSRTIAILIFRQLRMNQIIGNWDLPLTPTQKTQLPIRAAGSMDRCKRMRSYRHQAESDSAHDFTMGLGFQCGGSKEDLYRNFMGGLDGTRIPS